MMKSKGEFYDSLHIFCKELGVPASLIVDPSGEQTSNKVKKFCNQVETTLIIPEESTQWTKGSEIYFGLFKDSVRQDLRKSNSLLILCNYCAERRSIIHNLTPRDFLQLRGTTPTVATFGQQGDISKEAQHGRYDWVYFREDASVQFPHQREQLGRMLSLTIK